jgi:hypothetical protein
MTNDNIVLFNRGKHCSAKDVIDYVKDKSETIKNIVVIYEENDIMYTTWSRQNIRDLCYSEKLLSNSVKDAIEDNEYF